jgi:hypothetical protein
MQVALILLACLGAVNAAAGVLEVDLVFPRNETYSPTLIFPVIFAFQNSALAPFLNPTLLLDITGIDNDRQTGALYDLRWANFSSSDPYYELRVVDFTKEGRWQLTWELGWDSCTEDSLALSRLDGITTNRTTHSTWFTIKNSTQDVDLVAATTNRNCTENEGVSISVATTVPVPKQVTWEGVSGACASLASTTPAPTPCQVKIDSAAALSMSSAMTSRYCQATLVAPGDLCSSEGDDKSTAQRLAGGAAVGLAAALGALGYIVA